MGRRWRRRSASQDTWAPGRPFPSARDTPKRSPCVLRSSVFRPSHFRPRFARPRRGRSPAGRRSRRPRRPGAVVLSPTAVIVVRPRDDRTRRDTSRSTTPDDGAFEVRVARRRVSARVRLTSTRPATLGTIALWRSAPYPNRCRVGGAGRDSALVGASSSVTVITRDDLEALRWRASRTRCGCGRGSSSPTGGRGALTSVFPRGGESDYSLVFIDGVQANAFGGGFDFAHLDGREHRTDRSRARTAERALRIERDRLGDPHRRPRGGPCASALTRRRQLRNIPRGRDLRLAGQWRGCGD